MAELSFSWRDRRRNRPADPLSVPLPGRCLSPGGHRLHEHAPGAAAHQMRSVSQQHLVGADRRTLHHQHAAAVLCRALNRALYFKSSTTAACPEAVATSRAVCRRLFLSPRSAPASSSALTTSPWPAALASIRAV